MEDQISQRLPIRGDTESEYSDACGSPNSANLASARSRTNPHAKRPGMYRLGVHIPTIACLVFKDCVILFNFLIWNNSLAQRMRSRANRWMYIVNVNLLAGIAAVRWAPSQNSKNRGAFGTSRSRLKELGGEMLFKTHSVTVGQHGVAESIGQIFLE